MAKQGKIVTIILCTFWIPIAFGVGMCAYDISHQKHNALQPEIKKKMQVHKSAQDRKLDRDKWQLMQTASTQIVINRLLNSANNYH